MIMKNNHNHKSPPSSISNNSISINDKNSIIPSSSSSSSSSSSTSSSCSNNLVTEKQTEITSPSNLSSQTNTTMPLTNQNSYIPTKLYVTNFPFTCTQRQIQDLFSQYGQVVECTLKKDYYAYILFTNVKASLNAYKNANGLKMFGRKLTVHLATSKKSQSHLHNTHQLFASLNLLLTDLDQEDNDLQVSLEHIPKIIHVRNFPETCSQQQVKDLFLQYGDIVECLILHDSYAFVHFKSPVDARLALQSTNNQPFMNSSTNLLVQFSRSKFKLQNTPNPLTENSPINRTTNFNYNRNSINYMGDEDNFDDCDYENDYEEDLEEHYETNNLKNDELNNRPATTRTKLYVTNFPEDMDQEEMKRLFNQYGQVLECTIMWNQYAFVHFSSYSEAEKALNGIKGTQYKGYKISVQWSTSSKYQQPKQHQQSKHQYSQDTTIKILERPVVNKTEDNEQSWASLINSKNNQTSLIQTNKQLNLSTSNNNNINNNNSKNVNTSSSTSQPFKISFSEIVRNSSSSQNGIQSKNQKSEELNTLITKSPDTQSCQSAIIAPLIHNKNVDDIVTDENPSKIETDSSIETTQQTPSYEKPIIGPIGTQQKSQTFNQLQRQPNNVIHKRAPSVTLIPASISQSQQSSLIQIPQPSSVNHLFQNNISYSQAILFDSHNISNGQQQQQSIINPVLNHGLTHHHHPSQHLHHQQIQNFDYQSIQHNYFNQQAPIEIYPTYCNPHHSAYISHLPSITQTTQNQYSLPNQVFNPYQNQFQNVTSIINHSNNIAPPLIPQISQSQSHHNINSFYNHNHFPSNNQHSTLISSSQPAWNDPNINTNNHTIQNSFTTDNFGLNDHSNNQYHQLPQINNSHTTQYVQQSNEKNEASLIQTAHNQFNFNNNNNEYSNGLLIKQSNPPSTTGTGLLTNGFVNLTISSSAGASSSSRSSSSSSSSSSANNFISNNNININNCNNNSNSNTASNSGSSSSTPTANHLSLINNSAIPGLNKTSNSFNSNGVSSIFNSYVLFPSDSFDLSNEQISNLVDAKDENLNHSQINNQSTFYQIEDVLANLIR